MTSGSFRNVSRPRDRRKSQSARLRVLASQSEAAWTAPKRFYATKTRSGHRPLLRFSGTIPESFLLRADEMIE